MRHSDHLRSDLQLPHFVSIFDRFYFCLPSEHSTCLSRGSPHRRSERTDFCNPRLCSRPRRVPAGLLGPRAWRGGVDCSDIQMTLGVQVTWGGWGGRGKLNGKYISCLLTKASGGQEIAMFSEAHLLDRTQYNWIRFFRTTLPKLFRYPYILLTSCLT